MLLYLIADTLNRTFTHPLCAPDLPTVTRSLIELNPENSSNLQILPLLSFTSFSDLLSLDIVPDLGKTRFPQLYLTAEELALQGQAEGATPHED